MTKIVSYFTSLLTGAIIVGLSSCSPSVSVNTPTAQESTNSGPQVASTAETVVLKFGVYTSEKPTTLVKQFRPVLNALEEKMSESMEKPVKIKMQVAKSYEEGISDLTEGDVDFSRVGPASYVEAKTINPDLSLLAMESKKGKKVFYGIIAVHKDSPIQNIQGLQGKSFAFGDPRSTIGRFLSQQYLLKNGIVSSDLSRYEYLERHDRVGTAVGLRQFDAGALKEGTFKKLLAKDTPIRELAKLPNVTRPWVVRSNLSEEVTEELRESLIEIEDPKLLKPLGVDGFLEGSDEDYQVVREAVQNNSKFFE